MDCLCWKIASVCQNCCTSWEPVHVLTIQLSWKSMTKPYATGFPKCVVWTSTLFRVLSGQMTGVGVSSASLLTLPPFWLRLLGRVTLSRRFSRKHSKMFHLQKRLRNGWVWRMNKKVLSMELNLSSSKPPKIWFLEWMTNVRKFSTLIKANSGLNGWTSFLVRTWAWNLMTSNSGFQLVYVSEPTFVLRIRATVVKELNGTVYTVFLAPRVLVASHVMVLSILS